MSDDKIVPPFSEDLINFVATTGEGVRESTHDAAPGSGASPQNKSLLMKAGDCFRSQPKSAVLVECVLLVLAIGYVDYITTWQWSMSIFYAIPILLTVWHGPRK